MPNIHTRYQALLLACLLCTVAGPVFAQGPTMREYPYLYRSTRAMGMGGAYTAIGGRVDTLFYNPAGLSSIPKDKGWEVNILNVSAETDRNALTFTRDMQNAFDTGDLNNNGTTTDDQQIAINNVFNEYMGQNLHLRVADFSSFGRNFDSMAFGIGALGSGRLDAIPHQGFGPEGLLELNADYTYGAVGGFSVPVGNGLFLGASVKNFHRESVIHNFTPQELVSNTNDFERFFTDDLRKEGTAVGFDAGVLWNFAANSWWRPSVGLSVMNIGDLDFKEAGTIPMTVNAGLAVNPRITAFRSLLIGFDYVDVLKNYEQDKDMAKRVRYGAELQLFDINPVELSLRAGMYEGYPTFGADLRVLTFLFSYAMYSEEVGAYAGQDRDTRHLVTFNFGW
ncbi:MAG: hypothetical protein ACYC7L_17345 [Nitrospirota bacterium]